MLVIHGPIIRGETPPSARDPSNHPAESLRRIKTRAERYSTTIVTTTAAHSRYYYCCCCYCRWNDSPHNVERDKAEQNKRQKLSFKNFPAARLQDGRRRPGYYLYVREKMVGKKPRRDSSKLPNEWEMNKQEKNKNIKGRKKGSSLREEGVGEGIGC